MIAVCRLRYCERTRAYAERRTAEGKTKTEIIRCLKRYIAREIYHALIADLPSHPRRPDRRSLSVTCGAGPIGRTRHALDIYRNVRGTSTSAAAPVADALCPCAWWR